MVLFAGLIELVFVDLIGFVPDQLSCGVMPHLPVSGYNNHLLGNAGVAIHVIGHKSIVSHTGPVQPAAIAAIGEGFTLLLESAPRVGRTALVGCRTGMCGPFTYACMTPLQTTQEKLVVMVGVGEWLGLVAAAWQARERVVTH